MWKAFVSLIFINKGPIDTNCIEDIVDVQLLGELLQPEGINGKTFDQPRLTTPGKDLMHIPQKFFGIVVGAKLSWSYKTQVRALVTVAVDRCTKTDVSIVFLSRLVI